MKKYTQKTLKNMVASGKAKDITNYDFDQMDSFLKSHDLIKIGISYGIYGINGGLLQDRDTAEFFAITARNTACMMAF